MVARAWNLTTKASTDVRRVQYVLELRMCFLFVNFHVHEGEVGDPVRILKGSLTARGGRSVAAACKRMKDNDIQLPDIINSRGSGFKQGALANLLTDIQAEELASGLK